jgi:uncharacterized protein (DUF2141 family)
MSKMFLAGLLGAGAAGALIAPVAAQGAALGPSAALCNSNATAVQVDVRGFKQRTGTVRVQIYSANSSYLEKRKWLERVDVPVSRAGTMSVCVPVKQQGNYGIAVRHDIDGSGKSGPERRRRACRAIPRHEGQLTSASSPRSRQVGNGQGLRSAGATKRVPVVLNYRQGPVDRAGRMRLYMASVALLSNPRSTGNKLAAAGGSAIIARRTPDIFHYEVEEVRPDRRGACARWRWSSPRVRRDQRRRRHGAGGADRALFMAAISASSPPPVAVLPNGKTNLIALDLGARGRAAARRSIACVETRRAAAWLEPSSWSNAS